MEFDPSHCGDEYNVLVRGAAGLGAHRHQDRLRGGEINGVLAWGLGKAAAQGGEAVVGVGSGSTKAVPHHQDSWHHKHRGHPDQVLSSPASRWQTTAARSADYGSPITSLDTFATAATVLRCSEFIRERRDGQVRGAMLSPPSSEHQV